MRKVKSIMPLSATKTLRAASTCETTLSNWSAATPADGQLAVASPPFR